MALDMSKYTKVVKKKRKLPIIFVINEKMLSTEDMEGNQFKEVIEDIMGNLERRSVDAVMSVVSFGNEVHLWSGFKEYEKYTAKEWPKAKETGAASFDIAMMLVKDMLEDVDTTPEGNYDPIVVLISSNKVSPDYEDELEEFKKDGRFKNVQRIGIADISHFESYYNHNSFGMNSMSPKEVVNELAPEILREFAGGNVAVYISDDWNTSWCTDSDWEVTETKEEYTWFCPVLSMMELRYTENGQRRTKRVCKSPYDGCEGLVGLF